MLAATLPLVAFTTLLSLPAIARADEPAAPAALRSGFGVTALLGGGMTGFTAKTMRNTVASDVGGLWDLRVTLGSHRPLAIDVGYIGTAQSINALAGTQRGTLVGTTAESALRWNILYRGAWNPYVYAGIGWQRYDISGGTFRQSDSGMKDSDNSLVFPMGAGVAYRDTTGLVAELRGELRANVNSELVLERLDGTSHASMHAWEASASVGYEF